MQTKKEGIIPLLSVNQSGIWRDMAKKKDLRGSLSKTDQQRHWPELFGGKGSRPRITGRLNGRNSPAYQDGWERIFGGNTDGED